MKEHRHAFYCSGSTNSGSKVNPSLEQKRDQDTTKVKVTNWFASTLHSIKGKSVMPAAASRMTVVIDSPKDASWTEYREREKMVGKKDAQLVLKVLHYIQKAVVNVRVIIELHSDIVQEAQHVRVIIRETQRVRVFAHGAQNVSRIQRPSNVATIALSRVRSRSGKSSIAAAILRQYRVRLDRRCARAGKHGRASERVVRTQPGRWWWGLRWFHGISALVTSTITCRRTLNIVWGRSGPWRASERSRFVGACDRKRLRW